MSTTTDRPGPGRRPLLVAALVALALLGALLAFWGWRGGSPAALVERTTSTDAATGTPAPTAAPQQTTTGVAPADDEAATATAAPRHTSAPTAAAPPAGATSTPAADPATQPLADIDADPVQVQVARGAEVIIEAPVAHTQLNARAELDPPPGVVGWYGPPDWETLPGELSSHPGVLAGHSTYDGVPDVFARLGEVRAGDTLTIGYADGQEAVFEVESDALSVPKNDVTDKAATDYAWVWSLPEPGRTVSIFSCDPAEGIDLTGHSVNNWVVQATRTA